MDALELLKSDHDRLKGLFDEARASESEKKQRAIFNSIRSELELHSMIEETVFYPTFRKYGEFNEIVERSFREHQEVKALINEIARLPQDSGQLGTRLQTLIDRVENHVREEEGEFFPMVRKLMRRPEREQLGRHLQAAKQERSMAA